MDQIRNEFLDRIGHIEETIKYIQLIESNPVDYKFPDEVNKNTVLNMQKAGIILALYNTIEFCVIHSIERIENEFTGKKINEFNSYFSTIFYKCFWFQLSEENFTTIEASVKNWDIANCINYWYKKQKSSKRWSVWLKDSQWQTLSIQWNIDFIILSRIAQAFSFKISGNKEINWNEACLLKELKQQRNNLAHWERSFIDVWQSLSANELLGKMNTITNFFKDFMNVVENYINEKKYLNSEVE